MPSIGRLCALIDVINHPHKNFDYGLSGPRGIMTTMKSTRYRISALLSLSVLLGALIWFLSPLLTGHEEPWDARSPFYPFALVAAGFIPACFSAHRFWLWAVGVWLGQVIAFLALMLREAGSLWPLGLLFLCFSSLLSLAGAGLGAGVHLLFRRFFSHSNKVA